METLPDKDPNGMKLSLAATIEALKVQTFIAQHATGVGAWREQVSGEVDELLASAGVFPPSKPGNSVRGNVNSVWYALHMTLFLPAIKDLEQRGRGQGLDIEFGHNAAARYITPFREVSRHLEQWHQWKDRIEDTLGGLPENPEDLPDELRCLLEGELPEPQANHIMGRLLQAHYAVKTEDYVRFGLPEETPEYLSRGRNIFLRTKSYVLTELAKCPLPLNDRGQIREKITGIDVLAFYKWFASPSVVELVFADLKGAAEQAANDLLKFLDYVHKETEGAIDLTCYEVSEEVTKDLQSNDDLLRRFGLWARMLADFEGDGKGIPSGKALIDFATQIWPEETRKAVWGSATKLIVLTTEEQAAVALAHENLATAEF